MPSLQNIAEDVVRTDLPCLIADTCAILDVASGHGRLKTQSMKGALEIIGAVKNTPTRCMLVRASLVEKEFHDNIEIVHTKAVADLRALEESLACIDTFASKVGITPIGRPDGSTADLLKQTALTILDAATEIDDCAEIRDCAHYRVRHHLAPSKKGKDSYKDCIIFAEALELARLVNEMGGTKPVVCLTSNRDDYKGSGLVRPEIAKDAAEARLIFCLTWKEARYRLFVP